MDFSPIWISLKTATLSIGITFVMGIVAAYLVANIRGGMIRALLDGFLMLSQVLPPTVVGYVLLVLFGVNGPFGSRIFQIFGKKMTFCFGATVFAAAVISFPLMYRSARGAFEQVDSNLMDTARTLGMSELRIFLRVVIPNALPGIISGGILAFARGMGEFGATAMFAGNIKGVTRTLPMAIYAETAAGNMETAGVYAGITVALALWILLGINGFLEWYRRKHR